MEGTISTLAEKLHMCPGTFMRKLDGSRGSNPKAVPGVLARRLSNTAVVGLDNSLTSAISNALMDTGGNIFRSILTGETFNSFAAGQSAFNAGRENFIEDFITGAAGGMFRGDPVNAVYGFVYYNAVDFDYPGVSSLVWKRTCSSRNISQIRSHFGCGSGFSYGVYLIIEIGAVGRVFNVITTSTGQIAQVQYNGKTLSKYTYDTNLDLVQRTDVNKKSTHFEYDKHLLVKRTSKEGEVFQWQYTGEGHNAKCVYTTGEDRLLEYWFEYNEDHTIVINSLGHKEILHFTEDKILEKITHQNGHITIYEHSEYGEVTSITNVDDETVKVSYNDFGQPTEIIQSNGATHKIEYDEQGRIAKDINPLSLESTWVNEAGEEYTFERDTMGNVTTERGYDDVRKSYIYTPAGKLRGMRRSDTANWTCMRYDKGGFLSKIIYDDASLSDKLEEESFTYGIMGELLTAENISASFDPTGNISEETTTGVVWQASQTYNRVVNCLSAP